MAGSLWDAIRLNTNNTGETADIDIENSSEINKISNQQSDKMVAALNKFREVTNSGIFGMLGDDIANSAVPQKNALIQSELKTTLIKDYIGLEEKAIGVDFLSGWHISPEKYGKIAVNPQNVDALIAALEHAATNGEAKKKSFSDNGINVNANDIMAQVELTMRNTLKKDLAGITGK